MNFEGRKVYVGIDVHKKDWQVGIYYDGIVLGNHRMPGNSEKLISFLKARYTGADFQCVYECTGWGFNLQRALAKAGINCIVVNACDVPGSDKEKQNKTDKVDAVRLARHHCAGLLKGIAVPDERLQKERNLIRFRKRLTWDIARCKTRLKSLLRFQGLELPAVLDNGHWSRNLTSWIEERIKEDELLGETMSLMLEEVMMLRKLLLKTEKKIRSMMRQERYSANMELLTSIPGVGPLTSLYFLLEIGDINRFGGFDRLNNFVGFYPGSNSSGEKQQDTGITKRRHKLLRSMLIEASWVSIRRDPAMLETYKELIKRMKGTEAIVRIARKLLRRMRCVLLAGKPYEIGVFA